MILDGRRDEGLLAEHILVPDVVERGRPQVRELWEGADECLNLLFDVAGRRDV